MTMHRLPDGTVLRLHPGEHLTSEEESAVGVILAAARAHEEARRATLSDEERAVEDARREHGRQRLADIRRRAGLGTP